MRSLNEKSYGTGCSQSLPSPGPKGAKLISFHSDYKWIVESVVFLQYVSLDSCWCECVRRLNIFSSLRQYVLVWFSLLNTTYYSLLDCFPSFFVRYYYIGMNYLAFLSLNQITASFSAAAPAWGSSRHYSLFFPVRQLHK